MELTGRDFERIPRGNVRVPKAQFERLWLAAEQLYEREQTWANYGVVQTCRWMARATVRPPNGQWRTADAPITNRFGQAYQEIIQEEALAADKLLFRQPVPYWLTKRPGWALSVHLTFQWAWFGDGNPPIELPGPPPTHD
ncbi:hypothetical protein [Amycolatopsis sp. H20-H5]|uniref:hypothetical protein n=1 Tax=Amycolatopsis sp. H20-H5 TaxID=3046309 RepID=UPI002DBD2C49|nr:hypothetical protein [Amycolatopsis sp. H20-H5]MEC3974568.1 hypothetical protein [Amycolatopsis sp. H20-H5]